jgi:hypothetical protein
MTRNIWKRALMLIGATAIMFGASAATAKPASAQPPVVVVRRYWAPPVVVVRPYYYGPVYHPYWHRWYDYRARAWHREWR